MSTVGINFGAASSGQGFDVAATVTAILANESGIETPWKSQLTSLQAQDAVFTSLGTDLSTLTTSLLALTDFTGVLAAKDGSSSDTTVLSLSSAASGAVAGSHTIVVNKLASTSSQYSDATPATDVISGSLTIQVGSGQSKTITVDSSSNTLASLAAAINLAGVGVTANIISDSSGSRLSIVSGTGGGAGELAVTSALTDTTNNGGALAFHVGQDGQDAKLNVDGIDLSSGTNTVSTAIPGVTFQLLSVSTTPVQVEITNDNSTIESAFSAMVAAYNAVVKDVSTQEGKDASGNPEPLFANATLGLIQSQLSTALLGSTASGTINSVMQLGISFNKDGTLTLDNDALTAVLNSNFSDVVGFLQNSDSFGKTFATTLNNMGTQAPNGSIYLAAQQNAAQEAALTLSISNEDALLATQKISLTTELNTANQILQSIPEQLNEVNELYSAITGFNTGNGG
ncbi:flagellar filament capping protein FliD [Granulicella arctica]|uniref:flagellar filament capping protein FliD n=1 Tax=Granulicella arctica TaxID=940613 RepID=UPI0021E03C10|nr:flagellar filament capping protein FliD [Granulicella arctica]